MQLFYAINNWAGRNATLDEALRFFYVGAVPLLATLLAAALIIVPRHTGAAPRRRIALAAVICIASCLLALPVVNTFARSVFEADILSPRPFVTHRVNLLIVEPNDNSFPCGEVMLAAALAMTLWAAIPRLGLVGWLCALGLALTRVACGSNYVADVVVGLFLGGALGALVLSLCAAPLHLRLSTGLPLSFQPKYQGAFSGAVLAIICVITLFAFEEEPRFRNKLRGALTANASAASPRPTNVPRESSLNTLVTHEGEGMTGREGEGMTGQESNPAGYNTAPSAISSPADTSRDQHRSDFIPKADELLRTAWKPLRLPHRILTVDVAQVRAGDTAYRTAVVRFIIENRGAAERQEVWKSASRLIRAAYHADGQLQNVDVVGVMLNAQPADFGSRPLTTPGPLPVFSASVARSDIRSGRQLPANLEKSNPGIGEPAATWLRARSLIYMNERVLPTSAISFTAPNPQASRPTIKPVLQIGRKSNP